VQHPGEWPCTDRRRFRNLLLDLVSSDALPLTELLLRVHDDGYLRVLPSHGAPRAQWDAAGARLTADLKSRLFVESDTARWLSESWINALGPLPEVVVPPPRAPSSRPAQQATPSSARATTAQSSISRASSPSAAATAASIRAYRRSNIFITVMAVVFTVLVVLAFRSTTKRTAPTPADAVASEPASDTAPAEGRSSGAKGIAGAQPQPAAGSDSTAAPTAAPVLSAPPPITIAKGEPRRTDDIVLRAGRVFEGSVLGVRQTSVLVKDAETELDFEIPKSDIDKIVTRDGRVMRFSDDNVPMLGADGDLAAVSHSARFQLRYAERWGAQSEQCRSMAGEFAPGDWMEVRHVRGAPMLKLEFANGQALNANVRADGLFESIIGTAVRRGPLNSFVQSRLSGRFNRAASVDAVLRLIAVTAQGATVCDVALTMQGSSVR
jgi:hypothetical protein